MVRACFAWVPSMVCMGGGACRNLAVGDEVDATRVRLERRRELLCAVEHCDPSIAATYVDTVAAAGAADSVFRKFPRPAISQIEKRELTPGHGCT